LSRLGESLSPGLDPKQGVPQKSGRILAQAKLSRLDEIDSRSGDTSSPR